MKKLIIFVFSLVCAGSLFSQETFNKLYTHYYQVIGDRMIEHEGRIFIAGQAVDTLKPIIENNVHITSIDLEGNLINHVIYDNKDMDDELVALRWTEILVYEDRFLLPYAQFGPDCTLTFDEDLNIEEDVFCYAMSLQPSTITHGKIFPDDHEFNIPVNSNFKLMVTERNLDDNTFELHDFTRLGYEYTVGGTHIQENNQLLISGIYLKYGASSIRTDDVFGHFLVTIDADYNLVSEYYYPQEIHGSTSYLRNIVDHEGYLIMACMKQDRDRYNQGQFSLLPIIQKIDITTGEVLWESVYGEAEYERYPDRVKALEESHNKDGYIIVGNRYNDSDRSVNGGTYAKCSSDGDLLWYHNINDDHPITSLQFEDMIASSDGYYVAAGYRSDKDPDDGYDTRVQTWVIKFDENGELAILSNTEDQLEEAAIDVYPNPVDDILQITLEKRLSVRVVITDSAGQEVLRQSSHEKDIEVDMSTLAAGTYYVLLVGEDDALLHQEQVVRK